VLERDYVGYGASGGTAASPCRSSIGASTDLARTLGDDDARVLHLASVGAVHSLRAFVEAEGIDCDLMPTGMLVVSNGPEQDARLDDELATAARLRIDGMTRLDRAAVQAEIHSETLRCGLAEDACVLVNPAKLVRGLRAVAVRLGVDVFEGTPVEALEQGSGVTIKTPGGRSPRSVRSSPPTATRPASRSCGAFSCRSTATSSSRGA
jgi:glycine/D-amino acid oxidase-like deaminating enzyme